MHEPGFHGDLEEGASTTAVDAALGMESEGSAFSAIAVDSRDDLAARARMANLRVAMFGATTEPARVDRFVVLKTIGAGGMGVVHAAYDPRLDRKIALKLVKPEVAGTTGNVEARLLREAQAMARLSHPNVVQIYEVGAWQGRVFLAMELVAGRSLATWLAEKPRGWREVVHMFVEAGRGLAAAHAAGMVHRDFKPENVLVGDDGRIRVTDFGLARGGASVEAVGQTWREPGDPLAAMSAGISTGTAAFAGTPRYMSPEQFLGEAATAASDQFSYCVALYSALHGVHPFAGEDRRALAKSVVAGERCEPLRLTIPRRLHRALVRSLSRAPLDRFPSMNALLGELTAATRRQFATPVAATLVVGAALVGLAFDANRPCIDADMLLAGIWDPERRTMVQAAYAASSFTEATRIGASTVTALDDFARRTAEVYIHSCRSHQRGETSPELHDLRVACLRRQLHIADAVVGALSRGDADILRRAPLAAANLPDLEACADVRDLLQADKPRPEAVVPAAQIASLLDEARALELVGDFVASTVRADQAVVDARTLGYAPLLAEALFQTARLAVLNHDNTTAEDNLREALTLAVASHHDALVGELWSLRLLTSGGGDERLQLAEAWMQRADSGPLQRAAFDLARGVILAAVGDVAAAEAASGAAVLARAESLGEGHLKTAIARINHGNHLAMLGRNADALTEHRRALSIITEQVGDGHILTSDAHYSLATDLLEHDDDRALAEAESHLLAAHGIAAEIAGDVPPVELADSHIALAEVARRREQYDRAEAQAAAALSVYEHYPRHPNRGAAFVLLGNLQYDRERDGEALATYSRARELIVENNASIDQLGVVDGNIADILHRAGDIAGAIAHYESAIRNIEAAQGRSSPLLRGPLLGLLEVLHGQGRACTPDLSRDRLDALIAAQPDLDAVAHAQEGLDESCNPRVVKPL